MHGGAGPTLPHNRFCAWVEKSRLLSRCKGSDLPGNNALSPAGHAVFEIGEAFANEVDHDLQFVGGPAIG